jgi:signal transduction histidine kinase
MKVLIVDDRPENRLILETKMKAAGFAITSASNGVEALKILRHEPHGLVVTDLMMPQMDGYQLTHAIKSDDALRSIPVIVYTSTFTDPKDEALALNLGANRYVVKPASDNEFFAAVHEVIESARRGELPVRTPSTAELVYLREYSERLISKLEDKVAEQERAERELRELNASLEQRIEEATREVRHSNEELEAFAYSVSHDLRAPLRGIEGYIDILLTEPGLSDADRRDYLARTQSLALRGQKLIGDLLEYARLKSADLAPAAVSVAAAVETALAQIDAATRDGATIETSSLAHEVRAHERTFVQVLQNLIGNALKFSKPGEKAKVAIAAEPRDEFVRLSVRDEGIGIPAGEHARIFKPFERLQGAKVAGSGVGLAIVQRGVARMGGKVGVDSAPGRGSTFWIELRKA